jgi:hypothetical protein
MSRALRRGVNWLRAVFFFGSTLSISIAQDAAHPLWERVVVIGASASDGFLMAEPAGGPRSPRYRLTTYLDAALDAPHPPIQAFTNRLMFKAPVMIADMEVRGAREAKPTLLIALDFLFWFLYGHIETEDARLASIERGFAFLDEFKCPLVVGDFPDASAAIGTMLRPEQVPHAATRLAANRRLAAWAAERNHVRLVSLSTFMSAAQQNAAYALPSFQWSKGQTRALLQHDAMHPECLGCAALSVGIFEALQGNRPLFPRAHVLWDPLLIRKRAGF